MPASFHNLDWPNPVNWQHSLNRGLYYWFLGLPNRSGSVRWVDLVANKPGVVTNADPKTDWVALGKGRPTQDLRTLDFDGSNDVVSITDSRKAYGGLTKFTVSAWFIARTGGGINFGRIVTDEGTNAAFNLFLGDDGVNGTKAVILNTGVNGLRYDNFWTANTWFHAVGVIDGTNRKLYRNGIQVATEAYSTSLLAGSGTITIGDRASGSRTFDGRIDDVRIYAGVGLSAAEVGQLYRESLAGYPSLLRRRKLAARVPAAGAVLQYPQLERGIRGLNRGLCMGMRG